MIYEPASKKTILEHHSNKYFLPASTTKIFSFYAGLKLLKDSVPALKYMVSRDTLYFSGTGDPTFLHRNFDSSRVLDFLRSRPEVLVLIYPETTEKAFGPGWAWDDYNYEFAAERSSLPVYGNLVSFRFSKDDSLEVNPRYFTGEIQIDSTRDTKRIHRLQKKNSFQIPLFGTSAFEQKVPFITSAELTAQLLSDTLQREVHVRKELPQDVILRQKLSSHDVDEIYRRILQDSDNFFAEQLLLIAAGEISDTLQTEIAIDHMKKEFLQGLPDEIKWVDGSGLSRYNLITPRSMVWVLDRIYEEVPQERLFSLLPAGGISGTIKNDYKAPPGKPPFVYAKTGTLSNNHNLSGYLLTASGKVLIFSFMNNNFLVPTAAVKSKMDGILRELYLKY